MGLGGSGLEPLDGTAALHKHWRSCLDLGGKKGMQGQSFGMALVTCHHGWVLLSLMERGTGSVLQAGMAQGALSLGTFPVGWGPVPFSQPGFGRSGSSHPSRLKSRRQMDPKPPWMPLQHLLCAKGSFAKTPRALLSAPFPRLS